MSKLQKRKELINKPVKSKGKKKRLAKKYRLKFEVKVYLTLLFVSLLFVVLSFTVLFKIKNISVIGCDIYDNQEIIDVSGIKEGSNLLLCNKSNISKNIIDAFPYIEEVKAVKKLPSSVEINIKKGDIGFVIENNGEYFCISENGRILEKFRNRPENLLIILGVQLNDYSEGAQIEYKNPDMKRIIQEIRESIKNNNFDKINKINLLDLNKIILNYDNRIDLLIGRIDKFDYKIITAKEIIENKISDSEKGTLNLSELDKDNKSYFTPEYMEN